MLASERAQLHCNEREKRASFREAGNNTTGTGFTHQAKGLEELTPTSEGDEAMVKKRIVTFVSALVFGALMSLSHQALAHGSGGFGGHGGFGGFHGGGFGGFHRGFGGVRGPSFGHGFRRFGRDFGFYGGYPYYSYGYGCGPFGYYDDGCYF
jgi:hypothetical protein